MNMIPSHAVQATFHDQVQRLVVSAMHDGRRDVEGISDFSQQCFRFNFFKRVPLCGPDEELVVDCADLEALLIVVINYLHDSVQVYSLILLGKPIN